MVPETVRVVLCNNMQSRTKLHKKYSCKQNDTRYIQLDSVNIISGQYVQIGIIEIQLVPSTREHSCITFKPIWHADCQKLKSKKFCSF